MNRARFQSRNNQAVKTVDQNKIDDSKSEGKRVDSATCRKRHSGECWKVLGAHCGSKDHGIQNCPRIDHGSQKIAGNEPRLCYYCGKTGHFKRECPKLEAERQVGHKSNRDGNDLPPPPKQHARAPRVYELSEEDSLMGNFKAITGMLPSLFFWITCIP